MEKTRHIRLGSALVTFDRRRFVFQDAHDPRMIVTIEDADAAELILFLDQSSTRAADKVRVEPVADKLQASRSDRATDQKH